MAHPPLIVQRTEDIGVEAPLEMRFPIPLQLHGHVAAGCKAGDVFRFGLDHRVHEWKLPIQPFFTMEHPACPQSDIWG